MRKLTVIFNPAANRGDNFKQEGLLREMLERRAAASANDYELEWLTTESPDHATTLARQAAESGHYAIIAIGGDGTNHEVVNGMMQVGPAQRPYLGLVPTGTGNDLANNFGLSVELEEAVSALFSGNTRPLDVGEVSGSGKHAYWINTLGFGFSGAVTVVARSSTSFLRGFALYLYIVLKTIFFHMQDHDIRVTADDDEPFEQSISMANICNGPAEGGGFPVAPHAKMDDGLISYTFMQRMGKLQMLKFLPIVLGANHVDYPDKFRFGDAQRIQIESTTPLVVHIDGELFSVLEDGLFRFEARMIPAGLQVLCQE